MSVILYSDTYFRGPHKHIIGRDEPDLHQDGWGDRVSSIQVLAGIWDFYQDVNYKGSKATLFPYSYPKVEDFGINNDSLSSLKRITKPGLVGTPGLIAYEHIDFGGDHKHFIGGYSESNLHADGWGDRISSFQIMDGKWEFCEHVKFAGWKKVFEPGNYPWVEQVGIPNDRLSSIGWDWASWNDPKMPTVEAILYEHIDYGGNHKHLINHGQKNLHTDGWGDRVSSFQIVSGTRWTFHQHANYGGASIDPNPGSYRWIEDAGMTNDILSSVRANIVPVYFKTIQGASPNIARDLQVANQVFNPHGIEFFQLGEDTDNVPALLDLDQPGCPGSTGQTAEEIQLYNLERDHAPSDIVVYYLRSTSLGVRGCSTHPSDKPGSVVTDSETQYTMAHEIGHVLGLEHISDTTNLMYNHTDSITQHPPNLTNDQLDIVRGSKYLV